MVTDGQGMTWSFRSLDVMGDERMEAKMKARELACQAGGRNSPLRKDSPEAPGVGSVGPLQG